MTILILANGFLRDFNTRGAYGQGTYFAREARYSLSPTYAKPDTDASGATSQYLMLCRVLVGEACEGGAMSNRPRQKPNSESLYESMVDKQANTKIYVLSAGSDRRAYPEFVLRFHCT